MSAEPNNEQNEPQDEKQVRAAERTRAYRIRKRMREGEVIGGEDKAWFDNYEATKRKQGVGEPEGQKAEAAEPAADEPDVGIPDAAPPPPAPPRVSVGGGKSAGGQERDSDAGARGDWRKRYAGTGKDGRERTVLAVANQWRAILKYMESEIVMSGGTPMVPVDDLWPHIVLTVDDFLPENVTLKSSHIAVGGSTILLGQRMARRKKIGEAYARGKNVKPEDINGDEKMGTVIQFPGGKEAIPTDAPQAMADTPSPATVVQPPVSPAVEPPAPESPPVKIPVEANPEYTPGPGELF
jgi:hypothetical protein